MKVTMPDLLRGRPTPTAASAVEALQRLGITAERIEVVPIGALEAYKGEVVGQIPRAGDRFDPATPVVLFVSRNGISERLPHDFLEPLPSTEDESRVAIEPGQVMEYWERQVAAYGPGRRFVTVVDKALGRLETSIDRVAMTMSATTSDPAFARRVLEVMGHQELPITDEEALFLAAQAQRLEARCGVTGGMAAILEQLLRIPVRVAEVDGPRLELPPDSRRPLGSAGCVLGGGLPLGRSFRDPVPGLEVRLGPVPLAQYDALDRDPRWHQRVRAFIDLLAPAGCSTAYRLSLREEDRGLVLGDPLRAGLGRTAYL